MDKTRLALIGVGMIGKRHLKAMRDVEEAELAALVDTVPGVSGLENGRCPFLNPPIRCSRK